jgi:type II secretory pathway component PulF
MNSFEQPQRSVAQRLLIDPFRIGPSPGSLAAFYHQLAALLQAGLTVLRAFDTLREQSSGAIRRRLPAMAREIEDGGRVAEAFARFPEVFPVTHLAMIRAGEQGGRLDEVFETLADSCERRAALVKKLITGVLYPVFLLHFAALAIPLVERIRDDSVPYWERAWPRFAAVYALLFIVLILPRMLRAFPTTARLLDRFKGCIPYLAGVTEKLALARLAQALDGLYRAGVKLSEALPLAGEAAGNEPMRLRVMQIARRVEQGESLSEAVAAVGGFPAAFQNLLATGDASGNLSEMLGRSARYYQGEAETAIQRAVVVMPVVIYLVIAGYIAFQIIQVYTGLMTRNLGGLSK